MTDCPHIEQLTRLSAPKLSQSVHREECTQCFDNQDDASGIEVCLYCFNGGCSSAERHHAATHVQKSGHNFTLNIKRTAKLSSQRVEDEEPPAKMTKLAIVEEREVDKYEWTKTPKCWLCDPSSGKEIAEASGNPKVTELVEGVMQSMTSALQSEVKAWEEEILPCEHTLTLQQLATGPISSSGLAHCASCDLKENLWLCLTCGSLGCGRPQFGGLGGNGHALAHHDATGHGVNVKLGTITPEGNADIYCYSCNDAKVDPDLAKHLANFGINVQTQTKTEKSLTELQIEQNLKYEFSLTGDDGKALEPVFGPGLTGLSNLGNSCYMASVLQSLFALPAFQKRYNKDAQHHVDTCTVPLPADCVECQMQKVADGLLSGRYSHPARFSGKPDGDSPVFQAGVKPSGFKALIGKGHEEFSTMRQQDSEEFFSHLLTILRRDAHKNKDQVSDDATKIFSYGMEQRLECSECRKVRYRVDEMDVASVSVPAVKKAKDTDGKVFYNDIQLWDCLAILLGSEALEYNCPECKKSVQARKKTTFASFPDVLVVHAKKFQLVNWVPQKLDIPVILPENDMLEFDESHLGKGLLPDETPLPESSESSASALPQFNEAAMTQLLGMGFPDVRCQKALLATGNSDADAAMTWLFEHMDDPDIDSPIQPSGAPAAGVEPDTHQISALVEMGFTAAQARKALRETTGNAERAVEWLFNHPDDSGEDASMAPPASETTKEIPGTKDVPKRYRLKAFISHKGPSVHSGHYVAHIRFGEEWILFNDEKVVKADEESVKELKKLAYLYIFETV